jgi:hypothetical protein
MIGINQAIKMLPPPANKRVKVSTFQNTNDLTRAIKASHEENLKFAAKIAPYMRGANNYQTGKNIWNFLKTQVPYKVEPGSAQTTKTLPRMLNDAARGIGSDCKHYAVFTGSILQSLKIPFKYRLAGYMSNTPQHIYCVMIDEKKKEIPLDAVLGYYDYEKKPKAFYDMALYKLSGTENTTETDFSGFDDLGREYYRMGIETDQLGKIDIKKSIKKVTQGTKTLGLAVPRNAFMLLVKFNAFGFATKIKKLIEKKGLEGVAFWLKLGGNRTDLQKAADEGSKKKAVLGSAKANYQVYDSFGEPVTISAALASATPIVLEFKNVLKAAGITDEQLATATSKAVDSFKKTTGVDPSKVVFKQESGITGSGSTITQQSLTETTPQDAERVVKQTITNSTGLLAEYVQGGPDQKEGPEPKKNLLFTWIKNNPIIVAGGAFLIYSLVKSKK